MYRLNTVFYRSKNIMDDETALSGYCNIMSRKSISSYIRDDNIVLLLTGESSLRIG